MRDVLIIAATREREAQARRLIGAVLDTCTLRTDLVLAVDADDPSYDDLDPRPAKIVRGHRQDVAGWTNYLAGIMAWDYRAVVSMGDDHLPQTPGWDEILLGELGGRPGVAYGNDLFQRENWPTAALITTDITETLGYVAPPGVEHLYIDCFWRQLGEDLGNLRYRDDVIIEHVHPSAGKAAWDNSYARSNAIGQYMRDQSAYELFLHNRWPGDLAKLREKLGL